MSKHNVEDIYPLSPGQQGMLTVVLLSGAGSEVYCDQTTLTLDGELDAALWRRAWQRIVDRHPALRTLFVWERQGEPLQVVRKQAELPWQELDWHDLSAAERDARLEDFLRQDRARGFDLAMPPLMRIALIRWQEDTWKTIWSFHHLIVDGWSLSRIFGEVVTTYAALRDGREPDLEPPRRYRDYIAWLQRQDLNRAEEFWRGALAGFDEPTPLPYDDTGAGDESWIAQRELSWIPPAETEALAALARRNQLTLNTLFQGAWGALLARATGRDDVVFGSVVSGRPAEVDDIESVVGFFINVLPVRLRVGNETVKSALADLQRRQAEQRDFEYCLLESIQAWIGLPRESRRIGTLLVFQNVPLNPLELTSLPGFRLLDAHTKGATHYPITLYVAPRDGGLDLRLDYHVSRLDAGSARQLLAHLRTLLAAFASDLAMPLAELPLTTSEERRELVAGAAGPSAAPADLCIHTLFEEQAMRTPAAPAVEAAGRVLTYRELDERAEHLARRLRRLGIGPESIVGLCVERSLEMVVGMLGVLKAGGVYLPLDPVYPRERLAFMVEDSGARVLLTQERLADSLPSAGREIVLLDVEDPAADGGTPEEMGPPPLPGNGAYIIYTSGSSGRPKGVLVPHAALVNYVRSAGEDAGIGPHDRVLQFASMSFDTSAEEIYPCLTRGATLVLRDEAMAGPAESFLSEVERLRITILDLPTAYWHELVAGMAAQDLEWPAAARLVILGGEQAQAAQLDVWRQRVGERSRLLNTYGPTEATIVTTRRDLAGPRDFPAEVPIGRPVPGARVHVVSRGLEPLPAGLDGELVIGGAGLARGYLGRPDLTAERFVPAPFADSPGERLYRTGDLARRLRTGELEFRGRIDQQVKVRGFRIELGEIETALRSLPGVRDAVVVACEAAGGGKRLVAYVAAAEESAFATSELRTALKAALPDYMVPSAFVPIAELPRTPSGKVDRQALARLPVDEGRPDLDSEFAPPRNPVEEMLCGIWSELLGIERVGIHDDFFQLGGHSLLVAKVASRVRQTFSVELSMVQIFKQPTIAHLAEGIAGAKEAPELPPIRRAPRDRPIPLSFPQERVWFLNQLTPGGNIAYNFQFTFWARGPLRVDVLDRTFTEIVRRHEVLRTSFPAVDGRPVQVIHEPWPVSLPVIDLRALPDELRERESEKLVFESTQTPFDVSRIPLLRWRLLRLEDDLWELIQVEYHFVHDGWSFGVMLREIEAIYTAFAAAGPSPLPELPVQYADFALWQRSWMESEAMDHILDYWRQKLGGSPTALELPTDRPRPVRPSFAGELRLLRIAPELYQELRDFSRRQKVTLFMAMLAGYYTLLHRYTGQEDILVGTTNANRRIREIEGLIGMIVNSLILRGDLTSDPTFVELLARVREMTVEAQLYQDMPLERLVQELRPERQLSRNPLFQVMFHFHDAAVPDLDFAGLKGRFLVRGNRTSKMDLNVIVIPRAEQRVGFGADSQEDRRALLHWEYNTDLFDAATMERMIACYLNLLAAAARNPNLRISELPLLTPAEQAAVVAAGNDTAAEIHERLVQQLVGETAAAWPGAVAVSCAGETVTYGDLNARANRLAHRLRRLGVGPESRVAVCLERSPDLVAALLGVLKSGGAYVPLDPGYPADRLAWVLEDSRAAVLITQSSLVSSLPVHGAHTLALDETDLAGESAANPAPWAGGDNPAYVIYTSGSTGRPKGVVVRQRGLVNFLASMARLPGLGAHDVLLAVTTISFDIAGLELFLPLAVGGRVELVERDTAVDGRRLAARIASCGATVMQATPATWRLLLESGWQGSPGLKVLCGGEALPPEIGRELRGRVASLWNVYGPTETTIWSTVHPVSADDAESGRPVSLGGPIANTEVYLLDRLERGLPPMPDGVPGELYIGGEGLARGYFGRPDLTAERFLPDPFSGRPGSRLYRTGDLVRRRPRDSALEFLGRADFQVKIRGYRIELGEVESALADFPDVRQCVAVVREDQPGDRRLVAYLVSANGAPRDRELREFLTQRLPDYMVPADFVTLDSLPLSPAGKIDRGALPSPDPARREKETEHVVPRDAVEETLAAIWSEVLGAPRIGVRDDFFALGGHSLSAARVLARVRDLLRVELPLSAVFERRTIERMAGLIAEAPAAPVLELAPALPGEEMDGLLAHAAALSDADLDALLDDMIETQSP